MNKNIFGFEEFAKESFFKLGEDGKFTQMEWAYYKDHYPEKYGLQVEETKFTWVVKQGEQKVVLLSGSITEDKVKEIVALLEKNTESDGNLPLEKMD